MARRRRIGLHGFGKLSKKVSPRFREGRGAAAARREARRVIFRRPNNEALLQGLGPGEILRAFHEHAANHPRRRGGAAKHAVPHFALPSLRIPGDPGREPAHPVIRAAEVGHPGVGIHDHEVPIASGVIHGGYGELKVTLAKVIPPRRIEGVVIGYHDGPIPGRRQGGDGLKHPRRRARTEQFSRALDGEQGITPEVGFRGRGPVALPHDAAVDDRVRAPRSAARAKAACVSASTSAACCAFRVSNS